MHKSKPSNKKVRGFKTKKHILTGGFDWGKMKTSAKHRIIEPIKNKITGEHHKRALNYNIHESISAKMQPLISKYTKNSHGTNISKAITNTDIAKHTAEISTNLFKKYESKRKFFGFGPKLYAKPSNVSVEVMRALNKYKQDIRPKSVVSSNSNA